METQKEQLYICANSRLCKAPFSLWCNKPHPYSKDHCDCECVKGLSSGCVPYKVVHIKIPFRDPKYCRQYDIEGEGGVTHSMLQKLMQYLPIRKDVVFVKDGKILSDPFTVHQGTIWVIPAEQLYGKSSLGNDGDSYIWTC